MSDLLCDIQDKLCVLTLNRIDKHNAFDNHLLNEMQAQVNAAQENKLVRVIMLKANGAHFSAGADLDWMRHTVSLSEAENLNDAMILGNLMYSLHKSPKPTIAMVHGGAYGGGAGLAAACHIGIGAESARFCFSEVKIGLIPAVISPYVVKAIGARSAQMLFMSGELVNAQRALALNLIQHCIPDEHLAEFTLKYAGQIANNAPEAVQQSLQLAQYVADKTVNEELVYYTASLIAQKRVSEEGQRGIKEFLAKK